MLKRYYRHLEETVENHAKELYDLCKEYRDLNESKKLQSLFSKFHEDFKILAEHFEDDVIPANFFSNEIPGVVSADSCSSPVQSSAHTQAFNVNAPCFEPVRTLVGEENPNQCFQEPTPQWVEEQSVEGESVSLWHAQPVVHAALPWPHHYHLPHPLSTIYQSYQGAGLSVPLQVQPVTFPGVYPLPQPTPIMEQTQPAKQRFRNRHKIQRKSKVSLAKASPPNIEDSQNKNKNNGQITNKPDQNQNLIKNVLKPKEPSDIESTIEIITVQHGVSERKRSEIPKLMDLPCLVDDKGSMHADFPALSGTSRYRKPKNRLPRVKYNTKEKLNIQQLTEVFGSPDDECHRINRAEKKLTPASTYQREKRPNAPLSIGINTNCPCNPQVNLFTHGRTLYEKVPEDVLDEADGWKKVKPRFNKNRNNGKQIGMKENFLGVYSCKVCQSSYHRRYESANRHKHVNTGRNSRYSSNQFGSPRNNCTRETIPTHVLDLNYKNMLVSPNVKHRSGKRNNEVNTPASKNDRVSFGSPNMVSNNSGIIRNQGVLDLVFKNHTPVPSHVGSNCLDDFKTGNQDLDNGTCDDSIGTLLLSPFLDEDLQNHFPTLSTTVSSSSIVEDECNVDIQNNMDLSGDLSVDDDNTVNDTVPVVEDAHDMHEEFMKYLNCSTWPTQMDEIDKFESMIAGNNPSDPVLMYPSVSVEQFTEFIQRHPGEAQAFRRQLTFKLKKIRETENKQQQAYEKRLELLKCKTAKVRGFVQKVKDVQLAQDKLALKRKHQIDEKLRKAEENRKNYLSIIRRKAHDEEEKLKEIAFINELEAQNRRHDSLALRQEHEERLQVIVEERQRRVEEKAAKEAAVEERRKQLEAERKQKLLMIAEARKKKEEIIDRKQQERENQRLETAKEKAREREERLLARDAAQRATAEELQKRIQLKQQESARRHEENIESIRQRALEVGLHRNVEESINVCTLSKAEEPVNVETESSPDNVESSKLKASKKKRLRKIRLRLSGRSHTFLETYPSVDVEGLPFEIPLNELNEKLDYAQVGETLKRVNSVKEMLLKFYKTTEPTIFGDFAKSRGFLSLSRILKKYTAESNAHFENQDCQLLSSIIEIYKVSITEGDNFTYFVGSNDILIFIDLSKILISKLDQERLMKICENLLSVISYCFEIKANEIPDDTKNHMEDISGYIINVGIVNNIITVFKEFVRNESCHLKLIIAQCVKVFTALMDTRNKSTDLMNTLINTECFGTIPLLYEGLQKMCSGDEVPIYVEPIISLLLKFAEHNIIKFQDVLGEDGMALQIRAVASNLIALAKAKPLNDLLHDVILLVGFFAVRNIKNQTVLQSGQQPTVLQQLVTLPFKYFCEAEHIDYLFPTLYVCSFENPANREIVENDVNFSILEAYISSQRGKKNRLVKLFHRIEAC